MRERLRRNLDDVKRRIEAARRRGAHGADHVDLVVVTKLAPASAFAALLEAGVSDVGENRVQAAESRRPSAPPGLVWHGIGHLQRNKAARAVRVFDVFHAVDSARLAGHLASVLDGRAEPWPVYIEVNAARDPAKGGVRPEETLDLVRRIADLPALALEGLMTMARAPTGDAVEDEAGARRTFGLLRELRDEAVGLGVGRHPPRGLSMGMSGDYEVAVEEGATVVRVGSAIFEGVFAAGSGARHAEESRS